MKDKPMWVALLIAVPIGLISLGVTIGLTAKEGLRSVPVWGAVTVCSVLLFALMMWIDDGD